MGLRVLIRAARPWSVALLVACAPKAPAAAPAPEPAASTVLDCPDGAQIAGAPPPQGARAWCETADGVEHGPVRVWYPDGSKKAEGAYRRGRMDGQWNGWFQGGQERSRGSYRNGDVVGTWTTWFENGKRATQTINEGPRARFQSWYPSGGKHTRGDYESGREVGLWTEWDEAGKVIAQTDHSSVVSKYGRIGIPACDEYLKKYARCLEAHAPDTAAERMMTAVATTTKWRDVSGRRGRDAVVRTCQAALDVVRKPSEAWCRGF